MTPREQEILRRTELSETRVTKAVFPPTTNHHNTLFGGTALAWMDEVSFITATRFCRLPLVTVSTDRIDFNHPIPAGSIVELVGRVVKVGNTSLKVEVGVYRKHVRRRSREGHTRPVQLRCHRRRKAAGSGPAGVPGQPGGLRQAERRHPRVPFPYPRTIRPWVGIRAAG